VAGAAIGAHHARKTAQAQQAPADDYAQQQPPADDYAQQPPPPADYQDQAPQYAPPPADPADQIAHFAQLHDSGALTDEEFAAAKAKVLGT
jgi:hypothetical protein